MPPTALLNEFCTKLGNHICLIYENEEEWEEAVSAFLISGLEKQEKCICMIKNHTPAQILQYLYAKGMDINSDIIKKQLIIININSTPELENSLNAETIIALLGQEALRARTEGYAALRFTGELGWMLGHSPQDLNKMLDYVRLMNRELFSKFSCILMFRCFVNRYSTHSLKQIIMAHPIYIRKNKIYYNNQYRVPNDLLDEDGQENHINSWFTNIENEQENETYNRFLADIVKRFSQAFCATKPNGQIIACNLAFSKMLGYQQDEIRLQNIKDMTPYEWYNVVQKAVTSLRCTGKKQYFEKEFIHKSGVRIPVEVMMDHVHDEHGRLNYYCSFFTDISERYYSQEVLKQSEERYQVLFQTINGPLSLYEVIYDSEGTPCDYRFLDVNLAFETAFGVNRDDIIGQTLKMVIPQIDGSWLSAMGQAVLTGTPLIFQKYSPHYKKFFEVSTCSPGRKQLAVLLIDISELKNLEEELQEQLYFLQNILDAIPNPVFFKGLDGKYQLCNRAFEKIMGQSKETIIGRSFTELAPGKLSELSWEMDQKLFQTQGVQLYDGVLPYADGTIHDVIYNKATVSNMANKLTGLVGVTVDISERKRAQEALALSEEKFRNIFSQSSIGIALLNENGILLDANQTCQDIFGVSDLTNITGFELFDDPNLPDKAKQELKKGRVVRYQGEFSFNKVRQNELYPSKKTGVAILDYLLTPMKSQHGASDSFLVQVQDITEQKKAAIALEKSETQLRRITENMLDIICETDRKGKIIYISPSCKTVLGYEPEEALGHDVSEGTHPDDLNKVKLEGKRAVRSGSYGKIEFRYRHKNGKWVWLETIGNTLWNERGKMAGVVFVTRDISKRKQWEREMARLDRLRLVGEMAASMGHELRNPMTTVQGFLQLLQDEPGCKPYVSYFELMIEELQAANAIITEFISMAKDKAIYLKIQDMNTIVNSLYPLISAEALKSDKQVELDLGDIPPVNIDANEIRQLLLNLALNGLEAMDAGGRLFIRTFMANNKIVLAVQDQGKGIDPSIYDKLGTPFVTTKENGTGLGLAICYSIAARHNASISVGTGPTGTTFSVAFQLA